MGLAVTAGHTAGTDDQDGNLVPRKDPVGVLQVLLQARRLKVAQGLEYAGTLAEALQQFRAKTVSLTDDVVEWRDRPHDDLVPAVAVAAWQGERGSPVFAVVFRPDPPISARPRWWSSGAVRAVEGW
jgi:hypothetical protein